MPMAGYASRGANRASQTLHDLWAKALLIEDAAGRRGLLVTMDLCGIDRTLSDKICQRLSDRLGLQRSQIILSVSHTHSGPVVADNLRPMHYLLFDAEDQRLVREYADFLIEQVVVCAEQAAESSQVSRVACGMGHVSFATNRRNNPEPQVPLLRSEGKLAGPVDYSVPVLAIYQQDELIASVFGYACHCTTLSGMQWSGDYAGVAQALLEEQNPGCIAMFWAGCGADQNPIPRRTEELVEAYGQELAQGVARVLAGVLQPVEAKLVTQYQQIDLALDHLPSPTQLQADSNSSNVYEAARAKSLLAQIGEGQALPTSYPYPVATWKLGSSLQWVALGGEVVVDYALAIRASHDGVHPPWVMAYANDVMAYIPSRRVLNEGGYEGGGAMVYYGLPGVWAPDVERDILAEVDRQLARPVRPTPVFPEGASPVQLQESGAGEGPLWRDDLGLLTSGGGHIMRRATDGSQSIYLENAGTNGLNWDSDGNLLMCQSQLRRIARRMPDGSVDILTDSFQGAPYNQPNDITLDSQGRIYFTDPKYGPRDDISQRDSQGNAVEGVYRIDRDGTVSRIITHEVDRPNGLVISADDRFLFVADNNNNMPDGARKLWRFELTDRGDIRPDTQTLLYDWGQTRGPDGMELDAMGRLYVAAGLNKQNPPFETQDQPTAGVYVFEPDGTLLEFKPIPRDECTNVAFGGADRKTLFVTAGGTLWSMPTYLPGR